MTLATHRAGRGRALAPILAALAVLAPGARADEGMWTFDSPPVQQLKSRYNFTPTRAWLDHVRLSCVRFSDGGSGSFVSPNGLVLTNDHIARVQLHALSTPRKDYVADGLYARTPVQEIKCPSLELNVLASMQNVTDRVQKAARGKNDVDALKARQAEIARITRESQAATGLQSQVVALYQGGEYWLYRYKRYTDVRLVFAPEEQIAFYGGDPDNFTFPRYDLDFALFRVYENGRPVQSRDYLKWDTRGAADGDLVFVAGHPGHTDRLSTMAQILFRRDALDPLRLEAIRRRIRVRLEYAAQGPEQARQVADGIFGLQNGLKDITGADAGLHDVALIAKKQKEEDDFRARVAANPEWNREYSGAWNQIAGAQRTELTLFKPQFYRTLGGGLAGYATGIVRYVAEVAKPDSERLPGYHDAQLTSRRFFLLAPDPIYPDLEERLMADDLAQALEKLGPDDSWVKTALSGRTPAVAARALVAGTQLADPAFRKTLLDGGQTAVAASTDPLIVLARALDPLNRALEKQRRDQVESVEQAAGEKIGQARFAVYGRTTYPDATFTLRLAYGPVVGYPMNGTQAPARTTFYGLYDRANSFHFQPPFNLPARWVTGQDKLNLATPYDFVCACDIIGGNSGSPVINRDAALVGLIFDGNIESLVGDYVYDGAKNRAVAVHPAAIIEALRRLYDAGPLADELEGKNR